MSSQPPPDGQHPQHPHDTGHPQHMGAAHEPQPAQPASAPRRVPLVAWIGAGFGVLVVLAIIATVVVMQAIAEPRAKPEATAEAPAPTESEPEPPVTPEETPDPAESGEAILLTESTGYTQPLFWNVPLGSGWTPRIVDQGGQFVLDNPSNGCTMLTYQGADSSLPAGQGDFEATGVVLQAFIGYFTPLDMAGEPVRDPDDPTYLNVPQAQGGEDIEFGHTRFSYSTPGGEDRFRQAIARGFPSASAALYAEVDCPDTAAARESAQEAIDQMAVLR